MSDDGSWVKGYFTTRPDREREAVAYVAKLDPALPTIVAGDFNEEDDGLAMAVFGTHGSPTRCRSSSRRADLALAGRCDDAAGSGSITCSRMRGSASSMPRSSTVDARITSRCGPTSERVTTSSPAALQLHRTSR